MRVVLLSENLQKKLPFINKAVSQRSQLPILLNFLLETKEGKLQISSTDLEIGIQIEIPANVEEEGGVTVPAKIFSEIINSLSAEKITIYTQGESLFVETPKTKSSFQTISKEEFPKLYEEKGLKIAEINREELSKNFIKVVFCASLDTGRPALSGVLIKKEEQGFLLVATDGYRLSLKHFKVEVDKEETGILLVPARAIREILSVKDQDQNIGIYVSKKSNQVLFEQNGTILVGRLIEAEFPAFERIIPTSFSTKVFFDKEEMLKAVKMSSIFARETANIIKLNIKKDKIIITANTPSVGDNTVEIEAKIDGEENEIAFNAKYVLDVLMNTEENDLVFEMTNPTNPGVFKIKGDASFLHLIMPIRVQS